MRCGLVWVGAGGGVHGVSRGAVWCACSHTGRGSAAQCCVVCCGAVWCAACCNVDVVRFWRWGACRGWGTCVPGKVGMWGVGCERGVARCTCTCARQALPPPSTPQRSLCSHLVQSSPSSSAAAASNAIHFAIHTLLGMQSWHAAEHAPPGTHHACILHMRADQGISMPLLPLPS